MEMGGENGKGIERCWLIGIVVFVRLVISADYD